MSDKRFGIIVIGDEILNGRRKDRHFQGIGDRIRMRGYGIAWLRILSDDPAYLEAELSRTMSEDRPVFCCGGIGATPDDHTRACAAKAAGVPMEAHKEFIDILVDKFGDEAYPTRVRMADLPKGSALIPNSYNRIPGFYINQHYFMPGFPDMAHPMTDWVLEQFYPLINPEKQKAVWVEGAIESKLVPIMDRMMEKYPKHKLFSLPRLGEHPRIELGYRGDEIDQPFKDLLDELNAGGFTYTDSCD
jgi:molybdopterin-biosynthesis enzyme MoeA-like protein